MAQKPCTSYLKSIGELTKYSRLLLFEQALIILCFFTTIIMIGYFLICGESITREDFTRLLSGNRLHNWYFSCAVVLYTLFALLVMIVHKFSSSNLLFTTGLLVITTSIYIVFGILVIKHLLGDHWMYSLYAFPCGSIIALYGDKIKIKKRKPALAVISAFTLILFFVIHYSGIINGAIKVISMTAFSVLFAYNLFTLIPYIKNDSFFNCELPAQL